MKQGTRALVALTAFAVAVAGIGAYFYIARPGPAGPSLYIPEGTAVQRGARIVFAVEGESARVTGGWFADKGGIVWIMTPDKDPTTRYLFYIPARPWNGTLNVSLLPGTYVIGFVPYQNLVVTQEIRMTQPGGSPATDGIFLSSR